MANSGSQGRLSGFPIRPCYLGHVTEAKWCHPSRSWPSLLKWGHGNYTVRCEWCVYRGVHHVDDISLNEEVTVELRSQSSCCKVKVPFNMFMQIGGNMACWHLTGTAAIAASMVVMSICFVSWLYVSVKPHWDPQGQLHGYCTGSHT